jgi:CheY-like chemotaxis protein
VLLVDDNAINRKVGTRILSRMGFACDIACNGEEAVDSVARGRYDFVLMDCLMPVMDGYQATSEIRRREERGRHLPIVALTAALRPEERRYCLESGMDAILEKPLTIKALQQMLRRHLRT